jgi:hypothetical protein
MVPKGAISSKSSQDLWDHPEGPNIGFESNSSWLTTKESRGKAKIDLLHRGHTKGGKLVIVMVGLPGKRHAIYNYTLAFCMPILDTLSIITPFDYCLPMPILGNCS